MIVLADYYPILSRAINQLADNDGAARRTIYERARVALVTQLRAINDPPLSESDITRERLALEEGIRKVEAETSGRLRATTSAIKPLTDPLAELAKLVGQPDPFSGQPENKAASSATAPVRRPQDARASLKRGSSHRRVFISYRRDDARYQARDIYKAFTTVLPHEHVFMDVNSIRPGENFVKILEQWVDQCDILLALIGPGWANSTDPKTGSPRLHNPRDFVRIEIRNAIIRNISIVPVLLDGAPMPEEGDLPDDLRELVVRNAEFVDFRTFDADVQRLIRKLDLSDAKW
jgi:hypothetical protein